MNTKSALSLVIILLLVTSMLYGLQFVSFAKALLYQDLSTRIQVQSPVNNGSYAGVIPLNVTLRFDIHEAILHSGSIPYQNISCVYSLDKGEWTNIPFEGVASNGEVSDPLTRGYIYQIACAYSTLVKGVSAGNHFINVTVKPDGVLPNDYYSWYNDSAVYFTVRGPSVLVLSPENKTYNVDYVPLTFTVNESAAWTAYSLDNQTAITVNGNITLTCLANGSHSIVVYANDTFGDISNSDIVTFNIAVPPSPSPSLTQTPSPTLSPTPSVSEQPTRTPQTSIVPPLIVYAAVATAIVIIIIAVVVIAKRKNI